MSSSSLHVRMPPYSVAFLRCLYRVKPIKMGCVIVAECARLVEHVLLFFLGLCDIATHAISRVFLLLREPYHISGCIGNLCMSRIMTI